MSTEKAPTNYSTEINMHLLGLDIGSSSIKASLLECATGKAVASASSPASEMAIIAKKPGWAEQDPELWWENVITAVSMIKSRAAKALSEVRAVGISYQMHGLVLVDRDRKLLRPSIIWCDSRAVDIGEAAFDGIGREICLKRLMNSPGNFTASKLRWVRDNEPKLYSKIFKAMLPGDYIAMRLTGEIKTTPSGLSEGILWDFQDKVPATLVLDHYEISHDLLPEVSPTFSEQGNVTDEASSKLGIPPGTPVTYRAGDQPNNALSLNVLDPGDIAATSGTSGVVYGVGDKADHDPRSRVNTFAHVNYTNNHPRYGVLMCLNGAGILYSWLKHNVMGPETTGELYQSMNALARKAPIGSNGLLFFPYGNGAERTLENRNLGVSMHGLQLNTHDKSHLMRAAHEGIVFALYYGLDILRGMGLKISVVRAGNANMFLSPLFGEAFSNVSGASVELYNTDGSQGAARGAGIGSGIYSSMKDAFIGLKAIKTIDPEKGKMDAYSKAYTGWLQILRKQLG